MRWRTLLGSGLAVALAAPFAQCGYGNGDFACTSDPQCAGGECEPTRGFCAFPDSTCTSGFRFGDYAGNVSNVCTSAAPIDAPIDTPRPPGSEALPDTPPPCYGMGLAHVCFAAAPTGNIILPGTIDTSPGAPLCSTAPTSGPDACIVAAATITAPAGNVIATGPRPLILLATDSITVVGTLDVSSVRNPPRTGAGHPASGCDAGTPPGANSGGAGGSYGAPGAAGGKGFSVDPGGVAGNTLPADLHGGCDGQPAPGGGTGGTGGGIVYLISDGTVTILGAIDASGGGGLGAATAATGGGGGGAGGLVGIDCPAITNTGTVFANGGGGGEGAGQATAGNGGREATSETSGGAGGAGGTTNGGDGGTGGSSEAPTLGGDGATGAMHGGGGGGGGGAGYIKIYRGTLSGRASPPPS